MELQERISNKPKNYAKISLEKRMKLVELVMYKAYSIARASKRLNIKLSTCKLILKKYKTEGYFFQKRSERLSRLQAVQQSQNLNMSQVMPVMQEQFVVEQSENYNMSISYLNQIYMQYQYMMNADFLMRGNYYEIESLGYGGLINMGINYYFG